MTLIIFQLSYVCVNYFLELGLKNLTFGIVDWRNLIKSAISASESNLTFSSLSLIGRATFWYLMTISIILNKKIIKINLKQKFFKNLTMIEFYYGENKNLKPLLSRYFKEIFEADKFIQKQYNEEILNFLQENFQLALLGKVFKNEDGLEESIGQEKNIKKPILMNPKANLLIQMDNLTSREYLEIDAELKGKRFSSVMRVKDNAIRNKIESRFVRKSIYQSQGLIREATFQLQSQWKLSQSFNRMDSQNLSNFRFGSKSLPKSEAIEDMNSSSDQNCSLIEEDKNYNIKLFEVDLDEISNENESNFDPFLDKLDKLPPLYNYQVNPDVMKYLFFQYRQIDKNKNMILSESLGSTIFNEDQQDLNQNQQDLRRNKTRMIVEKMRIESSSSLFKTKNRNKIEQKYKLEQFWAIKLFKKILKNLNLLNFIEIAAIIVLQLFYISDKNIIIW